MSRVHRIGSNGSGLTQRQQLERRRDMIFADIEDGIRGARASAGVLAQIESSLRNLPAEPVTCRDCGGSGVGPADDDGGRDMCETCRGTRYELRSQRGAA